MSQLSDNEFLEYIDKQRKLSRPKIINMSSTVVHSENSHQCDREVRVHNVTESGELNRIITTVDTDIITGDMIIWSAAYKLMIKKFKPEELTVPDMTKFLASLEREANEYLKDCTDKEMCEQFPEYVRMLKVIYYELLERGVIPVPFPER